MTKHNTIVLSAILLVSACGEGEYEGIRPSDPEVLASFEEWERECVRWIRSDCYKAEACEIEPASDCSDRDVTLRDTCRGMAAEGSCSAPNPESFERCRTRTEGETCEEYCDGGFCFNFCFFSCLDS